MIHWCHTMMGDSAEDEDAKQSSGTIGPIGQQIGKQLGTGNQPKSMGASTGGPGVSTSSGANGSSTNWVFSGNTVPSYTLTTSSLAQQPPKHRWSNLIIGSTKGVKKSKVRYVIVKQDNTTLELREQPTMTPQEMIGITKFISLVSTYTTLILGEAIVEYNFHIRWSELIESLGISKHFVPGLAPAEYDNDANEVLDILLYDL